MNFVEPLDTFFQHFSDSAVITLNGGDGAQILVPCHFYDAFVDSSPGASQMDTTEPYLLCPSSKLTGVQTDDLVTVNGKSFSIIQLEPDGTGLTRIPLRHE